MGTPWRGTSAGASPGARAAPSEPEETHPDPLTLPRPVPAPNRHPPPGGAAPDAAPAPGAAPAAAPRHGVPIALDVNARPQRDHVRVEGYGDAVAGDVGGAIRGRRIDLC